MKKVINLKEIMVILISVILIAVSTTALATDLVLGNNNPTTITGNEYDNAQTPGIDNNAATSTGNGNNATNNTTNNTRTYNTNNKSDLPQTGIEDYNVGILLVICVASAIYAYKKVRDYKNI